MFPLPKFRAGNLAALNGPTRERFVALGNDLASDNATLLQTVSDNGKQQRLRIYKQFYINADTPYFRLGFPGFYVAQDASGEVTLGNSETPTIRGHITIGSSQRTLTFGGSTEGPHTDLVTNWSDNHQASDWSLAQFSKGTLCYVYAEINFIAASGAKVPISSESGLHGLEGWWDGGSSWYMLAGKPGSAGGDSFARNSRPIAIVGATNDTVFGAFGDSIIHGKNEDYGGYGDSAGGWFLRSCYLAGVVGNKFGIDGARVNECIGSSVMTNRLALVPYADVWFTCWGTNDANGASTGDIHQFEADLATFWASMRAVRRDIFISQLKIIIRTSSSTDDYITEANQNVQSGFASSGGSARATFNTEIDALRGVNGLDETFDIIGPIHGVNVDKWLVDGVTAHYATSDGTHLSALSNGLIAAGPGKDFIDTFATPRTTPRAFTFTDKTEAALSTTYTSNEIIVSNITVAVSLTITGGEYQLNGGSWSTAATTVNNGTGIKVRGVAPPGYGASTSVALTLAGSVSDTYSIATAASADDTPAAFTFTDQTGVQLSTLTESNAVTVSSINVAANISISGAGEYQINGGSWTSSPGTVTDGQTVKVRVTSSASYETGVSVTLSVGGTFGSAVTDTFTVTTGALWGMVAFTNASSSSGNITVTEPAGTQLNDKIIVGISSRDTPQFTPTGAWANAATTQASGNTDDNVSTAIPNGLLVHLDRGASAIGGSDLVFARTGGSIARAICVAYRKISGTAAVLDTSSANTMGTAATTITATGLTTAQDNELLVMFAMESRNSSLSDFKAATSPSTPSGSSNSTAACTSSQWLLRTQTGSSSSPRVRIGFADAVKATAGATGTFQYTKGANGAKDVLMVAAFK